MKKMYFCVNLVVVCAIFVSVINSERLGEVHTSMAQVSELVEAETGIVLTLEKYLKREEKRLSTIKRYVDEWKRLDVDQVVFNPLNSYHFLQRVSEEFKEVEYSLSDSNSVKVFDLLSNARASLKVPLESDVNGAAWALVRLQDVYNLTIDDLVQGTVYGARAAKGLTASDCLRFGEQSFQNLEFDLSDKWTQKGIEMIESKKNISLNEEIKVKNIRKVLVKRKIMRGLVTEIAQKSNDQVVKRFSGLGIPASFQKSIHTEAEANAQLTEIEDSYRRLCRGENFQENYHYYTRQLSCAHVKGDKSLYRLLMPFKTELLWPDPILVIYHDVLTDKETDIIRHLAFPKLQTTQVHSFTSHSAMKSLARVGKTAWVQRGDNPLVDKLLKRIEHMTGFSTTSTEDFHILNYGIGGHYDVHIDFFDLHAKNMNAEHHLGDRITTVLFYLNDVEAGGATVFPTLKIRVPAKKGSALVWFNLKRNGKGDYRTLHASCPVLLGQKWIANLWLHEFGQEFRWPCKLDPEQ